MPVVTIQQLPGRTVEQRKLLVKRIMQALVEAYNVKPEAVMIFLQDYEDDMWGKAGQLHLERKN